MPGSEDTGSVRAVERALILVELIAEHGELGLEELHYLTGLPKPSLSRLLKTLLGRGWLYRGLGDRRYRLTGRRLSGDECRRFSQGVVEQAAPLLVELGERTGLPADLALLRGSGLRIVECVVPSPLKRRYPVNVYASGLEPSLVHSAMGRACLGELDAAAIEPLLRGRVSDPAELERVRDEVRRLGFGMRTEGYWEYPLRLSFPIRAVALPLRANGVPIGAIALHWPADLGSAATVGGRHLSALEETVCTLQHLLDRSL